MENLNYVASTLLSHLNITNQPSEEFWEDNKDSIAILATVTCLGIVAMTAMTRCYSNVSKPNPDLKNMQSLANQTIKGKWTIPDGDAYDFLATHQKYIDENKAKQASQALIASLAIGSVKKEAKRKYGEDPEQIIALGQKTLATKSGSCDQMAAAAVAMIVNHIKEGGEWNSDVEVVKNGAHAFVIVGREGNLKLPPTWGKGAVIIDLWLAACGVKPELADELSAGDHGVISTAGDKAKFVNQFGKNEDSDVGAPRFETTYKFTAEQLKELAATPKLNKT